MEDFKLGMRVTPAEEFFGEERNGKDPYSATLPKELPPAPRFPVDALPMQCKKLADEAAKAIGCPVDFVAGPMLAVLTSSIGASRSAEIKRGWREPSVFWLAIVGESGDKKTPGFGVAMRPLEAIQREFNEEYRKEREEYEEELRRYEIERRRAQKDERDPGPPPEEPKLKKAWISDITPEARVEKLSENPRGLISWEDELAGMILATDQYKGGRGRERQMHLSCWSAQPMSVDRKTGGSVSVDYPHMSIAGGIQPELLPVLVPNLEDPDGMLARFVFCYPEPVVSGWIDDEIDEVTELAYEKLVRGLRRAYEPSGEGLPPKEVRFSKGSREAFKGFVNAHAEERKTPGFPSGLRNIWSKLEAYCARLALVLALCRRFNEGFREEELVEERDVENAIRLIDYFKGMARRVSVQLRGEKKIDKLAETIAAILKEQSGRRWEGEPSDFFAIVRKRTEHAPDRASDLSKHLDYISSRSPYLHFKSGKSNGKRRWTLALVDGGPQDDPSPPQKPPREKKDTETGVPGVPGVPTDEGEKHRRNVIPLHNKDPQSSAGADELLRSSVLRSSAPGGCGDENGSRSTGGAVEAAPPTTLPGPPKPAEPPPEDPVAAYLANPPEDLLRQAEECAHNGGTDSRLFHPLVSSVAYGVFKTCDKGRREEVCPAVEAWVRELRERTRDA